MEIINTHPRFSFSKLFSAPWIELALSLILSHFLLPMPSFGKLFGGTDTIGGIYNKDLTSYLPLLLSSTPLRLCPFTPATSEAILSNADNFQDRLVRAGRLSPSRPDQTSVFPYTSPDKKTLPVLH